jgi:tRNA(Ile)-lysidine synthase
MHFFRGTGIHGLRGMLPKQGKITRPLLFARKEELKRFAELNNLRWVEDSSNASDKYSRNYFRHQVIPLVQKIFPAAEENMLNNLQRFADIETIYSQSITKLKSKLLVPKGGEFHIPVLKLKKSEPVHTLVYEIIKDFGFTASQVPEAIALFESESGRYIQSATHRIIKNQNWLIIASLSSKTPDNILVEEEQTNLQFTLGHLQLKILAASQNHIPLSDPNIASLDKNEIRFPLLLRKWKQGDYFYPFGMKKKKKLSRFFIDQKLSLSQKEKMWVLEMNKKIIWVIGMRIDDRFRITENTKEILRISLSPDK